MKKILFALSLFLISSAAWADEAPTFQVGADLVVPWRVDSPSGRLGSLAGGHVQLHLAPAVTADFTALWGIEDKGLAPGQDKPTYLIPGLSLYLPTLVVQPYLSASMPILINDGQDYGVQGSGGVQFGLIRGLSLRYSVDVAYYFDAKAYVVNWVHAGAAITF